MLIIAPYQEAYNRGIFSIFFNVKVCCVFSLESPHRGDSNEFTQHTIINIKRKSPEIMPNTIMCGAMGLVRDTRTSSNSRGKRGTEVHYITLIIIRKNSLSQSS